MLRVGFSFHVGILSCNDGPVGTSSPLDSQFGQLHQPGTSESLEKRVLCGRIRNANISSWRQGKMWQPRRAPTPAASMKGE